MCRDSRFVCEWYWRAPRRRSGWCRAAVSPLTIADSLTRWALAGPGPSLHSYRSLEPPYAVGVLRSESGRRRRRSLRAPRPSPARPAYTLTFIRSPRTELHPVCAPRGRCRCVCVSPPLCAVSSPRPLLLRSLPRGRRSRRRRATCGVAVRMRCAARVRWRLGSVCPSVRRQTRSVASAAVASVALRSAPCRRRSLLLIACPPAVLADGRRPVSIVLFLPR